MYRINFFLIFLLHWPSGSTDWTSWPVNQNTDQFFDQSGFKIIGCCNTLLCHSYQYKGQLVYLHSYSFAIGFCQWGYVPQHKNWQKFLERGNVVIKNCLFLSHPCLASFQTRDDCYESFKSFAKRFHSASVPDRHSERPDYTICYLPPALLPFRLPWVKVDPFSPHSLIFLGYIVHIYVYKAIV